VLYWGAIVPQIAKYPSGQEDRRVPNKQGLGTSDRPGGYYKGRVTMALLLKLASLAQ
jgi:hypothetical protein